MAVPQGPNAEKIRAAVARIIASNHFSHAESVSKLLKFIVEQTLEGKSQYLKEYTLGVEVFHRGANFDSKEDTIVRVQARALRTRLDSYYQTDGRQDPIRVIVPKGSYVPTFESVVPPGNAVFGSRRVRLSAGAAMIAAAAGLAWSWSAQHWPFSPRGCGTLAILPFDIQSTPDQKFIGPALAQELGVRLSEVPGLSLISFESALQHKRSGRALTALHAACIVDGSVTRMGDEIEIQVFLKDGTNGRMRWQQHYRRPVRDLPRLEVDLGEAIAIAARPSFRPPTASKRPAGNNPEATLLYLEARQEFNKFSEPGLRRSVELYQQAIQRQPDYALSYAGLGLAWLRLANYYVPPNDGMPKARAAAQRALELSPELAEAHAVMSGVSLIYDWNATAAYAALQRAMAIAPSLALVNEMLALYNISTGRFDRAFANLRTARERDPLSIPLAIFSQFGLLVGRRYADAAEPGLRAVARQPNAGLLRVMVGLNLIYGGRTPEGITHLDAGMEADQSTPVALLAAGGFARAGSETRARRVLNEVKGRMAHKYVCAYEIASVHAALGESDEALKWLNQAKRDRCDCILWLNFEPWFDAIRGDPRFARLVHEVAIQ